jgi:hypothetical protein
LAERDVVLTGVFTDHSLFSFDLNSVYQDDADYFSPDATIILTHVAPDPGPLDVTAVPRQHR